MSILRMLLLAGCALMASVAVAEAPDGAAIARQGNGRGVAPCMACHAANGGGITAAGFPRLAALPQGYLRKQLDDFASGARSNATMQPIARGMNDAERNAVAAYYSKLPAPRMVPTASQNSGAPPTQSLATRGRWSQGVPACDQCHGPGGIGVADQFPPLAGQSVLYLSNQLHAWQQGARRNDPLQLMQTVAGKLNDADIAAISAWYAAQPTTSTKDWKP
jgi:cytochrome c553